MGKFSYTPSGVCCRRIEFEIEDDKIVSVDFVGGCDGNLKGIKRLVEGQSAVRVAELLRGVDCRGKGTSCPDQLAIALDSQR
ncbi:MAG: TIGR03905 family TSCPD domain-containing protein [Rikenellaceae bacterium]